MPNNLTSNQYVQDILAQPQALQDTLAALPAVGQLQPFARKLASGDLRRVVLTGMGSSYHIHQAWLPTLIQRNLSAMIVETSELIHYAPALIEPQTLFITVSQSGRSAEVIQLLKQVQGKAPLISITNSPDSPLAQQADATILTQAGHEFSVSCKTYTTALAVLAWLGDLLTATPLQATLAALDEIPTAVERYLADWGNHVDDLCQRLAGIQTLTYVGRGSSLAAVGTAALTTKEAARIPAEGLSSAAFRHGPLEMVNPHQFVLVYTGAETTATLNARLVDDIVAAGGRAGLIHEADSPDVFCLPAVPDTLRPIMEILPAQMLTLALAQLQGHEAGRFEHARKITDIE